MMRKVRWEVLFFLIPFLFFFLLMAGVERYTNQSLEPERAKPQIVPQALVSINDASPMTLSLPTTLRHIPPSSKVALSFDVRSEGSQLLFLNPYYSSVEVYANGSLLYVYGEQGSLPFFMHDPPVGAFSVQLPSLAPNHPLHIELVYTSPSSKRSLQLETIVVGSGDTILRYLFQHYGLSEIFALMFILAGLLLCGMSLMFLSFERHGQRLFWPGLMAFCAGIWEYSDNILSVYLTKWPSLLYILDFTSFFALLLPLVFFVQQYTDRPNSRLLLITRWILEICLIVCLGLQAIGLVPFTQSMYFFHILIPVVLVILTAYLIRLARQGSSPALYLLAAIMILFITAIVELADFYLHFMERTSSVSQFGILLFILLIDLFGCIHMRQMMYVRQRNAELSRELMILNHSVDVQKERSLVLEDYENELRKQRHDLRHHLRVMRQLLEEKDYEEAIAYLDSYVSDIPTTHTMRYCDNPTASAIISYYASVANARGIQFTVDAQIPVENPHISDAHLCVLLGNLLENAIEACMRMEDGVRYVQLHAKVHADLLFIAMDNSFSGKYTMRGSNFVSSKRNAVGTGLQSVQALAKQYGGAATFTPKDTVFRSEVYVRL